jgi:hypothetical protein
MSSFRSSALAAALALSSLAAQAMSVPLTANGQWHAFTVDALSSVSLGLEWIDADYDLGGGAGDFLPLSFTFTLTERSILRVVDAGLSGDMFQVNVASGGSATSYLTSSVLADSAQFEGDFDLAFADANFSRAAITLNAGTYTITGLLAQSASMLDKNGLATPLNSTSGAVSLTAAPVPEPTSLALFAAAFGVLVLLSRRRQGQR